LDPDDETVVVSVRVPKSIVEWLRAEPSGSKRGGISKAIRRLVKEEQWRREGRYVDVESDK
jgi:hypothetical protein